MKHFNLPIDNNRKDMISKIKVLIYKIDNNIDELRSMLNDKSNTIEEIALINYELWKLTGDMNYLIEAETGYKNLLKKAPRYEYRKRYEELKNKI